MCIRDSLYTENRNMNNLLNYILEDSKSVIENPEISVEIPNHIGEELFDICLLYTSKKK